MASVTPRAAMREASSPQKREEPKGPSWLDHILWPFKFVIYVLVYILIIITLLKPVPPSHAQRRFHARD